MENIESKIEDVLNHIKNVQNNCYKLGIKLIRMGNFELGRNLIKNGQIHDNSKFTGIEFEHLFPGSIILTDVIKHHASTNPHHPEYWGDIHKMPELYIAEMVCDCCGRGAEMGTDTRNWFSNEATKKYNFSMEDEVGRKITYFLDLLLVPVFKKN
jgi:hypothetical protein